MGILSGETWGSDLGGASSPKNYREEIPNWFYDHCYTVTELKEYAPEDEIALYGLRKREEIRERNKYPLGTAFCYCSESGLPLSDGEKHWVCTVDHEMWERWQRILMVPPCYVPMQMGYMDENYSGQYANAWWLRDRRDPCDLRAWVADRRENSSYWFVD